MEGSIKLEKQRKNEVAQLKVLNEQHLENLRRNEALHRAELEKRQRIEWRAHKQKLEELNNAKKTVALKEREIEQLTRQLLVKQDECDKLQDEIKRLKSAESWRSISPSSSTDDLSTSHITKRERDMAMRNSELSFRIRTLEDNIGSLRELKKSLEIKLNSAHMEIAPLKDHNNKLNLRLNEINVTLRSREKKQSQLSKELLDVKSAYQQLQEEYGKEQKKYRQHINHLEETRTQNQKLMYKNKKLKESYEKLNGRVRELEENNSLLLEQVNSSSLRTSPVPITYDDDRLSETSSSSQLYEQLGQLEFDKDELQTKYDEMKNEYKDIREKYKALQNRYQLCQIRHNDFLTQVQHKTSFDHLALEKEVMLLRSVKEENIVDEERSRLMLLAQEEKMKQQLGRIKTLESFIIEQDELLRRKELKWEEEQNKLSTILDELKIQMSTLTSVQIENLSTTSRTSIIAHGKSSLHDNEVIPNETAMLYNRENVHIGSSDSMGCTEILHRPIFSGAGDDQVLNDVKLKLNTGNVQYNERSNVEDNSGPNSSNFTLENLTDQRIELSPLKPPDSVVTWSHVAMSPVTNQDNLGSSDIHCKSVTAERYTSELETKRYRVQLMQKESEIENLQNLLSEAQLQGNELHDLLMELEQKWKDQEKLNEVDAWEKDDVIHELRLKLKNDVNVNGRFDRDAAVEMAHETSNALIMVERVTSDTQLLNKRLHLLRESIGKFFQVVLTENILEPKEEHDVAAKMEPSMLKNHSSCELKVTESTVPTNYCVLESTDFESSPVFTSETPNSHNLESSSLDILCRVFVVVMDYDPQSLCITGQPELELSLLSGSVISVFGEMDIDGYYTASYNDNTGKVPANFIQEIELLDGKLMSRLAHQNLIKSQKNTNSIWMEASHSKLPDAVCEIQRQVMSREVAKRNSNLEVTAGFPDVDDKSQDVKTESVSSLEYGSYKMYIGLYDYNPLTSSPSPNPEFELGFKEGSLMKIFGREMSDGYFVGELNGHRGLVPANFIADTSSIMESKPLLVTTKTMIAMYNYCPERDSPNDQSDMELNFDAGDLITVYGSMQSDGFYTGRIREKFGLVPSNFVQEYEKS